MRMNRKQFLTLCIFLILCTHNCPVTVDLGQSQLNDGVTLNQLCDPIFNFCPPIIVHSPFPQFCGIGEDKVWTSYTYICEAKNNNAIAYYDFECSCNYITCNAGYEC